MNTFSKFVKSSFFSNFILFIILVNCVVLALETTTFVWLAKSWLERIDLLCISIFVLEFFCKFAVLRMGYFRSGWNWFDFLIVLISVLPFSHYMSVFRALRVLRAFRIIEHVPALKRVINALILSIPGLLSTGALLLLVFFVFGVASSQLFGADFPQWFGHLGRSLFSLFQIMTLESWSMGIVRPLMEKAPYAWAFFIPFILITSFILLNFLIGIVVDAIAHLKRETEAASHNDLIEAQLTRIEQLLEEQKSDISRGDS